MSCDNSYLSDVKILPLSGFSGIHRKLRTPPNLSSGKKKISGVSISDPPKNVPSSAEPRTVPPSPGHITQLGTSDVPCDNTLSLSARNVINTKNLIIMIIGHCGQVAISELN